MKGTRFFIVIMLACGVGIDSARANEQPENSTLRSELLAMMQEDQEALIPGQVDEVKAKAIQAKNLLRMKDVIKVFGWPTINMVGKDGAQAAWILVQHADAEPDFQKQVLVLMEEKLASGQVNPPDYAYLHDRVNVKAGNAQRFATQGQCIARGKWQPFPSEPEAVVEAERKRVGLDPLAEYIQLASDYLCARFETPAT